MTTTPAGPLSDSTNAAIADYVADENAKNTSDAAIDWEKEHQDVVDVVRGRLGSRLAVALITTNEALAVLAELQSDQVYDEDHMGLAGGDIHHHLEAAARHIRDAGRAHTAIVSRP
jgi:hypothetical protein